MPRILVFDVYGTLLDIGSPVARLADDVGPQAPRLVDLWRAKQLEYAWVATLTSRYEPFWTLTERALDHSLQAIGIPDAGRLRPALLDAYRAPDVYAEVKDSLQRLASTGHRLAVFSNGNPSMLDEALGRGGIRQVFDLVISVDPVSRFKPDPRAYAHAEDALAADAGTPFFLSSNPWDVHGAATFGWDTAWVNRKGSEFEFGTEPPGHEIRSLDELPGLLRSLGEHGKR